MSLTQFTSITGTCVPVLGPDMDTGLRIHLGRMRSHNAGNPPVSKA